MQTQKIECSDDRHSLTFDLTSSAMLLVGSETSFSLGAAQRIFCGKQFRIAGLATTLLEGLGRIQSAAIELVLLSCEFCEAELALFAFDARRRGFEGLILHLPTPYSSGSYGTGEKTQGEFTSESESLRLKPRAIQVVGTTDRSAPKHPLAVPSELIILTPKQRSVLNRVAEGRSNLEIATELNCSEGSIKASLQELFHKFQVRKRARLVRLALENRFVDPTSFRNQPVPAEPTLSATSSEHLAVQKSPGQHRDRTMPRGSPIHLGDFVVDESNSRVWVRGAEVLLTPLEYKLLEAVS